MQTSSFFRTLCRLLIVALFAAPFTPAMAAMIGTDQALAPTTSLSHRSTVLAMLERSEVATQLQSQGIDPANAKARVATMTDGEVASLAGQINALPAGAGGSSWVVAAAVGLAIWYFYFR